MPFYAEKPHILVVDDDDRIRDLLRRYLLKQDYVVSTAANAFEAEKILKGFVYDLLVLDVMMPGQSGFDFTKTLRDQNNDLPIILLTAKGEVEDRVEGLTIGADDYLVKPFEPKELDLRIQAILKRTQKYKSKESLTVKIGDWAYDRETGILENESESISLTDTEKNLCNILIENANNHVSRYDLADRMGFEEGNERSIDVQITRLRKKLKDNNKPPKILRTIRGKGYSLKVEDLQ